MKRSVVVGSAGLGVVVMTGGLWSARALLNPRVQHPTEAVAAARLDDVRSWFAADAVASGPTLQKCELSGGTTTTCFAITLWAEPATYEAGPWCPRHIEDGPDVSGIWFADGEIHAADGAFIENLPTFYGDDTWRMHDRASGVVNLKAGDEGCDIAADPHPKVENYNFCIECDLEHLAERHTATYLIPVQPIDGLWGTSAIGARTNVGVSFDGPAFDGPAPIDAILGSYTLGLLDPCGGHINPHVGYHIHAVTDCVRSVDTAEDSPIIGLAMDGYSIHARGEPAPSDLDECGGHEHDSGYHYHAGAPGDNQILACLRGEAGETVR